MNMENIWRFGLSFFFNMENQDLVILKLQALKVFKYIPCAVFFYMMH